jgi:hypothetical protein
MVQREAVVSRRAKRRPVRTETCDEDDTLRLAHLIASISRRCSASYARALVDRAFAFTGTYTVIREAERQVKP